MFEGLSPASATENEWVEIVAHFSEAIADHFIFMRAISVEMQKKFKELYSNRMIVLRTPFEDRLQLFLSKDVDETTKLGDYWPV